MLENIAIPAAVRVTALTAGVAALLLNLTVSGGIAIPTVAQPLWIAMALALNAVSPRLRVWNFGSNIMSVAPLPLTAAIALVYLLVAVHPAMSASRAMAVAASWREGYLKLRLDADKADPEEKPRVLRAARNYVQRNIQKPLEQAVNADPGDINSALELSRWYARLWELVYDVDGRDSDNFKKYAILEADRASQLDPQNPEPLLLLYNLNVEFAKRADLGTRAKLYTKAARAMEQAAERVPTRAAFEYWVADSYAEAGNPVDARRHAERARQLDQQAQRLQRKLSDQQREQIEKWLSER
jgi:hypothetical protein